jgi:hypothetical protein
MQASIAATLEDDDGIAKKHSRLRKSTVPSKQPSAGNRFEHLQVEESSDEDDDTFTPADNNTSCGSVSDVQAGTDVGEISNNEVRLVCIISAQT